MKKKKSVPQSGITGIILANQWDEIGQVTGVSLYTDQEEVYSITQNKKILELISLVQTKVRVEGRVEEGADGLKSLYVETLEMVKKDNEK